MIHWIEEGDPKRLGLNFYRAAGGFVLSWLWYDAPAREIYGWRFRFRWHIRPRFLFSTDRHNVVHGYLWQRDCVVVDKTHFKEMCADLGIEYTEATYEERR